MGLKYVLVIALVVGSHEVLIAELRVLIASISLLLELMSSVQVMSSRLVMRSLPSKRQALLSESHVKETFGIHHSRHLSGIRTVSSQLACDMSHLVYFAKSGRLRIGETITVGVLFIGILA